MGESRSTQPPVQNRQRRPSSFLTEALIVDTAMSVVSSDGSDALTFRRLGAELGVDHTAILRHFGSKDGLLLALAARLTETALAGFEETDDWRTMLLSIARRVRAACREHPAIAVLAATRTSPRPQELRGANIVIGALLAAGLRGPEVASCYRAVVDTAFALAAFEASTGLLDDGIRESDRLMWRREYLVASPVEYPHLASVARELADIDDHDHFETTMGLFLDAIEMRAARDGIPRAQEV